MSLSACGLVYKLSPNYSYLFFFFLRFRIRLSFLLVDLKAIDKICKNEIFIRKFKIMAGRLTKENKIIKPQAFTYSVKASFS